MQRICDGFCLQIPMVFRKKKKVSQLFFNVQFTYLIWIKYFMIVDLIFILIAKESKFWIQTIIFTMKCIDIRESFLEYCSPPLEPTKAFACICVDLIWTIYQSGVLALGGGNDIWEPKTRAQLSKNGITTR